VERHNADIQLPLHRRGFSREQKTIPAFNNPPWVITKKS
jgi:hypothetical protein